MKNLIQIIAVILIFAVLIVYSTIAANAATPDGTESTPDLQDSELPPDIFDDECDGGASCPGKIFQDMPAPQHWSHVPIDWALTHHITSGTSSKTFSPDKGCSRAEAVTFLWRASGSPEPVSNVCPFRDVPETAYYYKAVLWAVENQVTSGTSAGKFSPAKICTRAQIVMFLWRAKGSPAMTDPSASIPFQDVPEGSYYRDAVAWAVQAHVTSGTSARSFSPEAPCTRAQIVTFLYKAIHG
jgi:hypothetical protein